MTEIKTPNVNVESGWLIERTSMWGTEWFCAGKQRWTNESNKAIRLPDKDAAEEMWHNWKIACGNKPVPFPYTEEGGTGEWEYAYDVTEHMWLSEPCHHALDLALVTQERDELRDCFMQIETWANAYPLDVFPEPDLKRAHEVLKAAGMTLDAISASSMRHVLNGVMEIAKRALKTEA